MSDHLAENRILSILDAISNGNEMDVPLRVTTYSEENPFPQKSQLLLFWLSLHRLDLLFIRRLASIAIKKQLRWIDIQFIPGFKCFYGNIHAGGVVSLCDTIFVDYANIFIGEGTGFSYQNMVITSNHDMSSMNTIYAKEIVIGQNVWIGSRVTILGGVHIGQNTVIGAGSVVTKDIPPNVFAAGIPAKPLYEINREPFRKRR
jgi:acetyltransferase-like isoleucine patch superfamily enzyme